MNRKLFQNRLLVFLVALALVPAGLWAYELKYVTTRDGLTNSSILSLYLKDNGELAIGTCDGVNAFDGRFAWRLYSKTGSTPLRGNIVEDMIEGRDGILWTLTNQGLNRMKDVGGLSNTFFPKMAGCKRIRRNAVRDIFLLTDGLMYCTDGVESEFQEIYLPGVKDRDILEYVPCGESLFFFTREGICRYKLDHTDKGYTIGEPTWVADVPMVHASHDGDVVFCVGEDGMLHSYNVALEESKPVLSLARELQERGNISQILAYKDYLVVSFSDDGFIFFKSDADGRYSVALQKHGVGIFTMEKDLQNDAVWIGSDGMGLIRYSEPRYKHVSFSYDDLMVDMAKPVRAVLLDRESNLWIGTKGGGIIALSNVDVDGEYVEAKHTTYTVKNSLLGSDRVYAFAESEGKEGFWICHESGLNFYSYRYRKIMSVPVDDLSPELPLKNLSAAYEYQGTLWLASAGDGVYEADVTVTDGIPRLTNVRRYVLDEGKLSSNYFFGLGHNGKGDVWFANRGMGVCRVKDGQLQRIHYYKTYIDGSVNDVFAVQPVGDDLWIGTGAGIIVQKADGEEMHLTMADGLPNNTIHALITDGDKHIFATTNNGIACYNYGNKRPTVLNTEMEVTEYSDGAVSRSGDTFFFGGVNGFSVMNFNPDVSPRPMVKSLNFIGLKIYNENVNIKEVIDNRGKCPRLVLKHNQNTISLRVSAMDYTLAEHLQYAYRLHNNEGWTFTDNTNNVNLAQLQPGVYALQVKCINRITGEESPISLLDLRISDPWYLSWMACLVYFLLVVALVIIFVRMWWRHVKGNQQMQLILQQKELTDRIYEEKMNFLTNVVHELNTPLTLINGPCDRIMNYASKDSYITKYIKLIMQNIGRLNYLIQEIIDFRRITTGHHKIEIHRVDVSSVVKDTVTSFEEMADNNHIVFEEEIPEEVIWNTDERALLRIVSNLVANAFKYTKQGGKVRLTMSADNPKDTENPMLRFSVYNTGKGISLEQQAQIFDYYTVFENVKEGEVRGLTSRNGLGMSICYKMVKKLNGTITIDSKVGEYAQFDVALPMLPLSEGVDPDEVVVMENLINNVGQDMTGSDATSSDNMPVLTDELGSDATKRNKSETVHLRNEEGEACKILVVDDNVDILDMLADCLEGYNVIKVQSAEEGFERMKEGLPDLIITDIMMPGINGLDFTQSVKKNKHTMHIPLIILSAKNSEEERIEGLESGADTYISKPFSVNYLLMTVRRLLENSKLLKEYYTTSASAFTFMGGKLVKNEERDFINEVGRIINENLMNSNFSPEDLAQELLISSRNLYRKFNELGLPTPNNYIKKYKIELAAKFILTTDMTIQEIIYSLGFNTRSQFYNEFRKHYSMTPKQYRDQHAVRNDSLEL